MKDNICKDCAEMDTSTLYTSSILLCQMERHYSQLGMPDSEDNVSVTIARCQSKEISKSSFLVQQLQF